MTEKTENFDARLYSFGNFYFGGIHAGIQTAHSVARMSQKYSMDEGFVNLADANDILAGELFGEWAKRGGSETIIVKNGGMAGDIENFIEFMSSNETLEFPWDYFNESEYAANGATTNISMVLPERIWKFADALRRTTYDDYFWIQLPDGIHYLVDDNYNPVRLDNHIETMMTERSHEKAGLPLINWEKLSTEQGREMSGQFISLTDFERELIVRMNRSGLM